MIVALYTFRDCERRNLESVIPIGLVVPVVAENASVLRGLELKKTDRGNERVARFEPFRDPDNARARLERFGTARYD